jgi:hypothetical protein
MTPRIRSLAIRLLECRADCRGSSVSWVSVLTGIGGEAYRMAHAAYMAVPLTDINSEQMAMDALEAAALLRDGWEPGDLIHWRIYDRPRVQGASQSHS